MAQFFLIPWYIKFYKHDRRGYKELAIFRYSRLGMR